MNFRKQKKNPFKKLRRKQIFGALLSAALTLFCLVGLYNMEFCVDASNTVSLEAAIGEYFFTENVEANLIESCKVGGKLLVFFEREGYSGHYGTALLERGVLGNYRFIRAGLSDWPLYDYSAIDEGGKHYLIFSGVNELEGVRQYAVYPSDNPSAPPLFRGEAEAAPFLTVVETPQKESAVGAHFVHYYDAEGNELDQKTLRSETPEPAEGRTPGVGSAELGMIYVYLAIVLLLGAAFVRYFLAP